MVDPRQSVGQRSLKANAAIAALPRVVSIVIQLGMSPFIVLHVGLHDFGFWALLLGAIQIVQIADGGLPYAASVLVARARGRGDTSAMRSAVTVTGAVIALIGATIVAIGVGIALLLPSDVLDGLPSDARLAIVATAAAVALTMLTNSLNAGPAGLERWEMNATTLLVGQVCGSVAILVLLLAGGGVGAVAIGYATGTAVSVAIGLVQLRRLGLLHLRRSPDDRSTLRTLRGQGVHLQVVAIASIANAQADRFLLLPFTSLAWIGAYDLGARVALALRAFPVSALGPVISRVAGMHGRDGFEQVKVYYRHLLGLTLRFAVAPLLLMAGAIYAGVLAWLGTDYTTSATVAAVLTLGTAVNMLTAPGTATGNACGRAHFDRDYSLLMLGLKVVLSIALGLWLGPWGVVCATPLGIALSSLTLVRRVNRWTDTRMIVVLREDPRTIAAIAGALLAAAAGLTATLALDPAGRPAALALCLLTLIVGGAAVLGPRTIRQLARRALRRPSDPGAAPNPRQPAGAP